MGILNLKHTRIKEEIPDEIVADLDAIISKRVGFKFNGKTYVIEPISTEKFLIISQKIAKLATLAGKSGVLGIEELAGAYCDLITSAVSNINEKEIMSMTQTQIAALVQVIYDCIQGKATIEKKNPQMTPTHYEKPIT